MVPAEVMLPGLLLATFCNAVLGLPPGFVVEPVFRFKSITDVSALPSLDENPSSSSMLMITSKTGEIHIVDDPDNNPSHNILVANLADRLCLNGERGLGAAIAHPDFRTNRFIYVYYTYKGDTQCEESSITGPVNRCSRFRMFNNYTVDTSTERVLFQTSRLHKRIHNAGGMVFGPDGLLYVSVGDGGTPLKNRISQNTSEVLGTIVRLTDLGGIPTDNPYAQQGVRCQSTGRSEVAGAPCQEIFALGLRNPFKILLDPNEKEKTRFLINDVGGATWEETSVGGTDFVGANYGYPLREGPCHGFGPGGNNIGNCEPDANFEEPLHYYQHRDKIDLGGGCITDGAIVPSGYWPVAYDGVYFFSDFVFGEILYITPNQEVGCRECEPPLPAFQNHTFHKRNRITSMVFAAYKDSVALYFGAQGSGSNSLFRVVHVGGENGSPTAQADSNQTVAAVGETVYFHAQNSQDPEGDPLSFLWEFGDNQTASGVSVEHEYTAKGVYTIVLIVRDGKGGRSTDTLTVTIGTPPNVTIQVPAEGTRFFVGEVFTLVGQARDFKGNELPASALTWEVRQHHSTHWHPFLDPSPGNEIVLFPAPSPEDFLAATNSHLEILLTATDTDGLKATVSRVVLPKTVWLTFDTDPPGLDLYLDSYKIETPKTVLSWENHPLHAVARASVDDTLLFAEWSDGGSREHVIPVATDGEGDYHYVAEYHLSTDVGCPTFSSDCFFRILSLIVESLKGVL